MKAADRDKIIEERERVRRLLAAYNRELSELEHPEGETVAELLEELPRRAPRPSSVKKASSSSSKKAAAKKPPKKAPNNGRKKKGAAAADPAKPEEKTTDG